MRENNECECGCYQKGSEDGATIWREFFAELRTQLRQTLYEKNVKSNPAVSDQWIIDELRKLLGIENSLHRFLFWIYTEQVW